MREKLINIGYGLIVGGVFSVVFGKISNYPPVIIVGVVVWILGFLLIVMDFKKKGKKK